MQLDLALARLTVSFHINAAELKGCKGVADILLVHTSGPNVLILLLFLRW
jgi:hypothetical protein